MSKVIELERALKLAKEEEEKQKNKELVDSYLVLQNRTFLMDNEVGKKFRRLEFVQLGTYPVNQHISVYISGDYRIVNYNKSRDDNWSRYLNLKEIEENVFQALLQKFVAYSEDMSDYKINLTLSGRDCVDETRILKTLPYYTGKYIELNKSEQFLLGPNIFMNEGIFFLTADSMKYLSARVSEQRSWDEFASSACAGAGERWRNSRLSDMYELETKIRKAYDKNI